MACCSSPPDDGVNGVELWRSDRDHAAGRPWYGISTCHRQRRLRSCTTSSMSTARSSSPPTMASMASSCGAAIGTTRGRPRCAISIPHRAPVPILPNLTNVNGTSVLHRRRRRQAASNCGAAMGRYRRHESRPQYRHGVRRGLGARQSRPTSTASLYFTADDGVNGVELWRSDGTDAGTVRLASVNASFAGLSNFGQLTTDRQHALFHGVRAHDGHRAVEVRRRGEHAAAPHRYRARAGELQSIGTHRHRKLAVLRRGCRHAHTRTVEERWYRARHGESQLRSARRRSS